MPAVIVPPGGYQLVFASGKDRSDPQAELHAGFSLSGNGEYLALVKPDAETIAFDFAPEYPEQHADVSYGAQSGTADTTLLDAGAPARAFVPSDGSLGQTWTAPQFGDAGWTSGTTGVGFETESGYENAIGLDLQNEMFGQHTTAYIRAPFQVDNVNSVDTLSLGIQYDDGFVAHLNGQQVASGNALPGGDGPDNGLVAYYPFDGTLQDRAFDFEQNSGSAANDLSGQGGSSTRYVAGKVGQGVALNQLAADRDRLTAPQQGDLDLGGEFTIEAWIYPTSLSGWGRIALMWDNAGGNSLHLAARNGTSLSLLHTDSSGGLQNVDSSSGVLGLGSSRGWQHIAAVGDGTNLRIYHNGVDVSRGASGLSPQGTPTPYDGTTLALNTDLGLGDSAAAPFSNHVFNGYLDEVAMWNVALTSSQIASHFASGSEGLGLTPLGGGAEITWDAAAAVERPDGEAIQFDQIDLSSHIGLLQPGENMLAIQGLNLAPSDPDFLITPRLTAGSFQLLPDQQTYFDQPTPGTVNGASTFGFVEDTTFSVDPRILRRAIRRRDCHDHARRNHSLYDRRQRTDRKPWQCLQRADHAQQHDRAAGRRLQRWNAADQCRYADLCLHR